MRAIITVGLGFGDEGKGATVDFLTRTLGADLVVRYSGGAQAGHNVQLADGRRHTFSQFGAGALAGANTYLGPRMIMSPATMVPEADHLMGLGVANPWSTISVHPECLVTTTYHMMMNRLREVARGDDRHGSCGLGIGEARHYWLRYGNDAVFAKDLDDGSVLKSKLNLMRDRFLIEMQELGTIDLESAGILRSHSPGSEANELRRDSEQLKINSAMPHAETVIFEGSQGVLLDEWKGFHPYTTWSTVTPQHALEMLDEVEGYEPVIEKTVVGITRAYSTRHGAGPFPAFCPRMTSKMVDRGNPLNDWQGAIRFGPLDLVLLEYSARVCNVDSIFVNGIDELPERPRVIQQYRKTERLNEPTSLEEQEALTKALLDVEPSFLETTTEGLLDRIDQIAPVCGVSRGPRSDDRELAPFHRSNTTKEVLERAVI